MSQRSQRGANFKPILGHHGFENHGKIIVTKHNGARKELQVGDVVSTQLMADFEYKQGEIACSFENNQVCEDDFLYTTMSSWVGVGKESYTQIQLSPTNLR